MFHAVKVSTTVGSRDVGCKTTIFVPVCLSYVHIILLASNGILIFESEN